MRLIAKRYDIRWTNVPFKSFAESSVALLGGHIDMILTPRVGRRW